MMSRLPGVGARLDVGVVVQLFPEPNEPQSERPSSGPSLIPLERTEETDRSLVERVATGNPAALAELFDGMVPLVRGMLVRALGGSPDVDDLMQDIFLVVIRRCRTLQQPERLRSFVIGVTVRTAKKALRRRGLRRWVGWEQAADKPPIAPAYDAARGEQVRRAYAILDRMSPQMRLIFALRHVEGLELTEVAQADGCSLATIKRRLARAERQFEALAKRDPVLRELVEEDC